MRRKKTGTGILSVGCRLCERADNFFILAEEAIAEYLATTEAERKAYEEEKATAAIKAMEAAQDAADEAAGIVRFRKPSGKTKPTLVSTRKDNKSTSATNRATTAPEGDKHVQEQRTVKKSLLSFDAEEI